MLGVEAARALNRDYVGPSVHRRGSHVRGMFIDGHVRVQESVVARGNMCPIYLANLGNELSMLGTEIFEEFIAKVCGETDVLSPQGRTFGSCPMLMTQGNCPEIFNQVRQTTLFSVIRNYMCKY